MKDAPANGFRGDRADNDYIDTEGGHQTGGSAQYWKNTFTNASDATDGSAVTLADHMTLGLNSGITYAGGLSVAVEGEEAVTGAKLEIGSGLDSLGDLTITLTGLGEEDADLEGYRLFSAADGGTLSDELIAALKQSLKSDAGRAYRLTVGQDGLVTLEDYPVLTWNGGNAGSWMEDGEGWNKGEELTPVSYESNADVIFAPLNGIASQIVTVSGAVHTRDFTVGTNDGEDGAKNGASYTFNGTEGTSDNGIDISGNLTLAGTWQNGGAEASSQATFNVAVSFTGESRESNTITGEGTVTFGAIQGNHVGITIGDGTTSTTVHFTDKQVDTTMRHFGAVEVKANSKLVIDVIQGSDAWGNKASDSSVGNDYVCGDGTVVLRGGNALVEYGGQYSIVRRLFDSAGEDAVLDTLELENIILGIRYSDIDNALNGVLDKHLKKFVVKEGSTLQLNSNYAGFTKKDTTLNNTLDLAGGTLAVTSTISPSIGWDVVLSDDATIDTSGNSLNITGTLKLSGDETGHTLTKTGSNALNIGTMVGVSDTDKNSAGNFVVNGGTVEISGLENEANTYVAGTVDLKNYNGDGTGIFQVIGDGKTYTVGQVIFGIGTSNGQGLDTTASLSAGAGATLVVAGGTDGVALQMQSDADSGWISGGGTVELGGKVTGSGRIGVREGTTLYAKVAWDDYASGLYLHANSTLKLGANVNVGWIGGIADGYGGSITSDGNEERTIKIVGGGGVAKDINLGDHVTLELADGSSGTQCTATITHLYGSGKLKLGQNATLTLGGTENVLAGITSMGQGSVLKIGNGGVGSLTVNGDIAGMGGTIQVYDGTNACTLTVTGNVATDGQGAIYLGMGGSASADNSSVTVDGNMTLKGMKPGTGNTVNHVMYYQHRGSTTVGEDLTVDHASDAEAQVYIANGDFTVKGKVLGGSGGNGIIHIVSSTLTVEGSNNEHDGFLADLRFGVSNSKLKLGTVSQTGRLTVRKLSGSTSGDDGCQQILGNGTLEVNVSGDSNSVVATGIKLSLHDSTTLEKSGEGTLELTQLTATDENTQVLVSGGTLKFSGSGPLDVKDIQVTGEGSVLELARQSVAYVNESNNITLSKGGELKATYTGNGEAAWNFGTLTLGENTEEDTAAGKITWSADTTGRQTFSFQSVTGTGDLDLGEISGENSAKSKTLALGEINGYSGTISGSVGDNGALTLSGDIVSGGEGTEGKIELLSGSVTLAGDGIILSKTGGDGTFTISTLSLASGQGLQMDYAGGELTIEHLELASGAELHYSAGADEDNLVELDFKATFADLFSEWGETGNTISLSIDEALREGDSVYLYLGIIANEEDIVDWDEDTLSKYFEDLDGREIELSWEDGDEGKKKLYLSSMTGEAAVRYWDEAWDDRSHKNGPNSGLMRDMGAKWYKEGAEGEKLTQLLKAEDTAASFADEALAMSDADEHGAWYRGGKTFVRLDKGSPKTGINEDGTKLSVLGGKLYKDAAPGVDLVNTRVYISLWAQETEHFHLLVGGSSYVATGGSGSFGFKGNTHIQVQGGTVDHIVGGNHVSNIAGTFEGNTYISVYEGASEHNDQGVPDLLHLSEGYGTHVRGGIVGGSTVTASGVSLDEAHYDFRGHTHINVYTVLRTERGGAPDYKTVEISDGLEGDDPTLFHIVGGNAWIGTSGTGTQTMVFSGSSNITVDLSSYQNFFHNAQDGAWHGGMYFEKAIVGGNYSGTGAGESEDISRTSRFVYAGTDTPGEHPYAVDLEIKGVAQNGESVNFLGVINGASRRDNEGSGVTEFDATGSDGILINLEGGNYRNYVAGGFWFGGQAWQEHTTEYTHTATLTSDIEVDLTDGEYWRVVGGSVNLGGSTAEGNDTMTGDTVVNVSGNVHFGVGYDLTKYPYVPYETVDQTTVGFIVGGRYLESAGGTYTQEGSTQVNILGGDFINTHIVAGDYVYGKAVEELDGPETTITGSTSLTLGGAGSDITINGLVVGGSYLADQNTGSSAIIGTKQEGGDESYTETVTHVTVKDGVTLSSETDPNGDKLHDGVALVAGSVLIDQEGGGEGGVGSGGHSLEIYGGTQLTIEGGVINGHVVGGSYTSDTAETANTLIIHGSSVIDITGGEIHGNVYGGHYSVNDSAPDQLELGNTTVTLNGGFVDGYIFGGSFRNTPTDTEAEDPEHPVQNDLVVDLQSGTLKGGVFVAGNNYNGKGGELHVHTHSTELRVGSEVTFELGEQQGHKSEYITLSGGYLRAGAGQGGNKDYSTVGWNLKGDADDDTDREWADESAKLVFTDSGDAYKNLRSAQLRLQDFDTVQVDSGSLVLKNGQMLVMHKVSGVEEGDGTNYDTFTKLGKGSITFGQGLKSWDAQNEAAVDFTGEFILKDGELVLGGGYKQSLEGGLTIAMYDEEGRARASHNKENAYLRGIGGTIFTMGELTGGDEGGKIQLDFELGGKDDIAEGVYYLVDGLDIKGLTDETIDEFFDALHLPESKDNLKYDLELRKNGTALVLRVHTYDENKWYWEGDDNRVWTQKGSDEETLTKNWTKDDADDEDTRKKGTYYFTNGAEETGDVTIDGSVEAGNVQVESGDYNFKQGGSGDGLTVTDKLTVGKEGADSSYAQAKLKLSLKNKNIHEVDLQSGGRLELANADAIQIGEGGDDSTLIDFNGGTLKYGENGSGGLVVTADLSGQVNTTDSTGVVRVQVGDSKEDIGDGDFVLNDKLAVTWSGDTTTKAGIKQAVEKGLVTSGRGKFTFEWQKGDAVGASLDAPDLPEWEGTLEAIEGTLEIVVEGQEVQIASDPGDPSKRLYAGEGATLHLIARNGGSTADIDVARAFTGTGAFIIGEKEEKGNNYRLSADNSRFEGTVQLSGDGKTSIVKLAETNALGGGNNTLVLDGRAIGVDDGTSEEAKAFGAISVKSLVVKDGTTNYIGGYGGEEADGVLKEFTITVGDGGMSGSGVMANAQGGYKGTLKGDLSGFEGTLVAGAKDAGTAGDEESTWTLEGTLDATQTISDLGLALAGTGEVIVHYTVSGSHGGSELPRLRLTGQIGDSTYGDTLGLSDETDGAILVLANGDNTAMGELTFNGHEIWLGDDDGTAGSWAGSTLDAGEDESKKSAFVLKSGSLGGALENTEGVTLKVDTAAKATGPVTVDVGGTKGNKFREITINENGHLKDVSGEIKVGNPEDEGHTKLTLTFSEQNIGDGASSNLSDYLIEFTGSDGKLTIDQISANPDRTAPRTDDYFTMDFSKEGLVDILKRHRDAGAESWLHLVTGGALEFSKEPEDQKALLDLMLRSGNYSQLLSALGFTMSVNGGDLVLRGASTNVYLVLEDESEEGGIGDSHTIKKAEQVEGKKGDANKPPKLAVFVDENTELKVTLEDDPDPEEGGKKGVTLNNLVGLEGSTLAVGDNEGTEMDVTLNNSLATSDPDVPGDVPRANPEDLRGMDTEFDGTIKGGEEVTFHKTGKGTLTVGSATTGNGGLKVEGEMSLEEGDLVVRGRGDRGDSHVGTLTFNYTGVADKDGGEGRGITVENGNLTVDNVEVSSAEAQKGDNVVNVAKNGTFTFAGNNSEDAEGLKDVHFRSGDGSGTLAVNDNQEDEGGAQLKLGEGSVVDEGLNVQVGRGDTLKVGSGASLGSETDDGQVSSVGKVNVEGTLDLSEAGTDSEQYLGSLSGSGEVLGSGSDDTKPEITITGEGNNGTPGAFSGTLSGKGNITVGENGSLFLDGVETDSDAGWAVTVEEGGQLDVRASKDGKTANLGDVTLDGGSNLTYHYSGAKGAESVKGALKKGGDGKANLTVDLGNELPEEFLTENHLDVGGFTWDGSQGTIAESVDGKLSGVYSGYFKGTLKTDEKREGQVYMDVTKQENNQMRHGGQEKNAAAGADMFWSAADPTTKAGRELMKKENSDLRKFTQSLLVQNNAGMNIDGQLAAGAGASISTLGPALVEDLHRQLKAIRNRTTTMGSEEIFDVYDEWPIWNMWINAENGYHRLDADGYLPGYTLNSWGGTLGVNLDVSKRTTVGLALTAMYGDLKTEAADTAKGDLDTFYLSGFARTMRGAWSHTFVVSGGLADIRLDRTVNYVGGSYRTHGSTEGYAFGALYEVGYTRLLNKKGTVALQPVANIEVRHVQVNGYTETGSDAGLKVDDIDQTVFTLGMGARMQAVVGHNTFNRDAIIEGRALVKADFGDRSGTAMNGLIGSAVRREVESAEVGAVGVEVGAGITVPLGSKFGSVFMDASFEYRQGWMSVNASAGYKITF